MAPGTRGAAGGCLVPAEQGRLCRLQAGARASSSTLLGRFFEFYFNSCSYLKAKGAQRLPSSLLGCRACSKRSTGVFFYAAAVTPHRPAWRNTSPAVRPAPGRAAGPRWVLGPTAPQTAPAHGSTPADPHPCWAGGERGDFLSRVGGGPGGARAGTGRAIPDG